MIITVTLTDDEVAALQSKFGADVDVAVKIESWVHDWMIQFTREHEERVQRDTFLALKDAPAALKTQVAKVVKEYRETKDAEEAAAAVEAVAETEKGKR
jgi:hypothetical protein